MNAKEHFMFHFIFTTVVTILLFKAMWGLYMFYKGEL